MSVATRILGETGKEVTSRDPFPVYIVDDQGSVCVANKLADRICINKFGFNGSVSSSAADIVFGGNYNFLTASATIEAISDSTADSATGTGARTIEVFGLDSSLNMVSASISMNGTSATAATTQSFFRVYRAWVATCGTYGDANVGNITIRVSGGGSQQSYISNNVLRRGQSFQANYTVPSGYYGILKDVNITVDTSQSASISLYLRNNCTTVSAPVSPIRAKHTWVGISGNFQDNNSAGIGKISAGTDIIFRATAAGVGTSISIDYDIQIYIGS